MTISANEWADGAWRIRVIDGRVVCPRVGTVDIDRCRECVYLLGLEDVVLTGTSVTHVVCSAASVDSGLQSAW
jgi:hypothetical protein